MCSTMTRSTVLGPPWVSDWLTRAWAACNAACALGFCWGRKKHIFTINVVETLPCKARRIQERQAWRSCSTRHSCKLYATEVDNYSLAHLTCVCTTTATTRQYLLFITSSIYVYLLPYQVSFSGRLNADSHANATKH